jgi:hypothetical protein
VIVPSDRKSTVVVIRRLLECAICLWWSIASVAASTPPLSVKRFSTDDGLPAHTVNAIVQTPDGYLWLATAGGLVRFDGLRFTVFNTQSGLPANRIDALAVSPDGALWLSPEEGYVMRRDPQRFTQMARGKSCLQLAFDRSGKLWCGYGRALQRLDKDSWLDATGTARRFASGMARRRKNSSPRVSRRPHDPFGAIAFRWRRCVFTRGCWKNRSGRCRRTYPFLDPAR